MTDRFCDVLLRRGRERSDVAGSDHRGVAAPETVWRVGAAAGRCASEAVAFAFDRRAAARALDGGNLAPPTCQLLPPGFAGFRPYCPFTASGTASGRPDLATARRLVERSGTRGAHVVVLSFDTLDRSVPKVMGPHTAPAGLPRLPPRPAERSLLPHALRHTTPAVHGATRASATR
jgi:hypothetical protein